jgi:hypothetical protein
MSQIRAATVSNLAGTGPVTLTGQFAAKAWVNFNGTGTVAIRQSGNVSSITDNGTGDYTLNFTNAMANGTYSGVMTASETTGTVMTTAIPALVSTPFLAGSLRQQGRQPNTGALTDFPLHATAVHGDLA